VRGITSRAASDPFSGPAMPWSGLGVVRGERKKDSWPEIEIKLMSTTEVLRGTLRLDGSVIWRVE
jgi:hypothetical protein